MKQQFKPSIPFQNTQAAQKQALTTSETPAKAQELVPPAPFHRPFSAAHHKTESKLSMATRRLLNTGLNRLQDPQPEGWSTRGLNTVRVGTNTWGMFPTIALLNAVGLLIVSFSYYVSILNYGELALETFFFLGLLFMFVPTLVRLLSATPARLERLCLLCSLGISFYFVWFIISPLHFAEFDEFLNWRTADDIFRMRHLFSENPMLPVGPYYPGLEVVTNAISTIGGLNSFHAGVIVICTARVVMVLGLFLLYEQLTNSSRMAGIATIIYMTNPHLIFFDSIFSYESLALPLATFMLYLLARYQPSSKNFRWVIFLACTVLLVITVTHHMTDYVFVGLLIFWTMISLFQASSRTMQRNLITISVCGVLFALAYALLVPGNPVWYYLSGYFAPTFAELGNIITGTSKAKQLFVGPAGEKTPLVNELLMAASIGLIVLALPFGLLSLWKQHRHDTLAFMLGIVSLTYPITQIFRLTNFGSEITGRSAAFLFLPIAYVLTILITQFWPSRTLSWKAIALLTCVLSVIFLGQATLESGPGWQILPGPYRVIADQRSLESDSIQAASWSLANLGANNKVGTDRINAILMTTFGDQNIVTGLKDHLQIAPVFTSAQFNSEDAAILQSASVGYLVVDLRLSTSLSAQGFYFEEAEPNAFHYTNPISRVSLTKFDTVPQINRVFDCGNIVIYDVSTFDNRSNH